MQAEPKEEGPLLNKSITRWILHPNESKTLYLKFFSTKIRKFNQTLGFEVLASSRQFQLDIKVIWKFLTINSNPKNVFLSQKRQRPSNPPDCYLHKTYISNKNAFDFGPLLIDKDPKKRHDDERIKSSNSTEFKITNCGKYDHSAKFCLESSLAGSDSKAKRSLLIFEPESMNLKIEEK